MKNDLSDSLKLILKKNPFLKSRWYNPYLISSRTAFPKRKKSGVYLIKRNSILYIGMSQTDLYKTMYRHFQSWQDKKQVRVTYSKNDRSIFVRVIYCTPVRAERLEKALILKYNPKDNPEKYENYKLNFTDNNLLEKEKYTPVDSYLGKGIDVDL